MSAFSKPFDITKPAGTDSANNGDDQMRDDKTAIKERLSLEHYSPDSTDTKESRKAATRLRPGLAGVMQKGSTATRTAYKATLTTPAAIDGQTAYGPGEGALFWDTDTAKVYRWNSSTPDWELVTAISYAPPVNGDGSNLIVNSTFNPNSSTAVVTINTLSQTQLNTWLGKTTGGFKFSDTKNTFVSLNFILRNTAATSWIFGLQYLGSSFPNVGGQTLATAACAIPGGSVNPQNNVGFVNAVIPGGCYFKVIPVWQSDILAWLFPGWGNIGIARGTVTTAEISAAFADFTLTAYYI